MPEKSVKRPKKSSALNALKRHLAGKEGTVSEMASDVKKVDHEQWRNPSQAEELARKYEQRIKQYRDEHEQRIKQVVDAYKAYWDEYEQRVKQFVDAYKDAMKNRSSSVDEWIQKYDENVDRKSD
jgi:ABC-type Zn uptake system ZnuABC Zn-binding protein ZnuA